MNKRLYLLCAVIGALLTTSQLAAKPPITVDTIHAQLLRQRWSIIDHETTAERSKRARTMAIALYTAVRGLTDKQKLQLSDRWVVGAVMSIWWHETRFSLEVHKGGRSRWGSDDGKAKCFGQLHARSVGIEREAGETIEDFRERQNQAWRALAGTDLEATAFCARATMVQFLAKFRRCARLEVSKDRWKGAFGDYGTGAASCEPIDRKDRNSSADRLRTMLRIVPNL